jgi:prepilin-type N-terminal cleavage/methylation domain-containing protein
MTPRHRSTFHSLHWRARAPRGFTLIEALVSMVLLAVILPVAMQGISLALRLGEDAKHRDEAATLAAGKLDELTATGAWNSGPTSGDFGTAWPSYRWTATKQTWVDSNSTQLTVDVFWTARQVERSVSIATLVNSATTGSP